MRLLTYFDREYFIPIPSFAMTHLLFSLPDCNANLYGIKIINDNRSGILISDF